MNNDELSLEGIYASVYLHKSYKHDPDGAVMSVDIYPDAKYENEEVYLSDLDEDNLRELLGNLIGRVKYLEKKVRRGNE